MTPAYLASEDAANDRAAAGAGHGWSRGLCSGILRPVVIKYLGSKRTLLPALDRVLDALGPLRSAVDLFSGTSRVGHAWKRRGLAVQANDHNAYAATLARCYVQADRETWLADATRLVAEFDALPGRAGWFTATYCEQSRYLQPHNGARIDTIREAIASKGLPPELEAILLVSLLEAADRVDSTVGVQMAYLKQWSPRSFQPLRLRVPELLPRAAGGPCAAHQLDAAEAVGLLQGDVVYLDPPYNQHKYLGNYHVWESLVLWDKQATYGIANKRLDCKTRSSDFNSRIKAQGALAQIIAAARCQHLVVSFNNEGYLDRAALEAMLARRGHVAVLPHDFRRYVGSQIGIYDPRGQRVGTPGPRRNVEYVFVASEDREVITRVQALIPP
jgi:adenine-specific DNA-methyltransferase